MEFVRIYLAWFSDYYTHWNLNSFLSHIYRKVSLLSAYVSIHKFDVIRPSESYLNSETSSHDEKLEIPGYNIITGNHPSNNNCRGAAFIIEIHYLLN